LRRQALACRQRSRYRWGEIVRPLPVSHVSQHCGTGSACRLRGQRYRQRGGRRRGRGPGAERGTGCGAGEAELGSALLHNGRNAAYPAWLSSAGRTVLANKEARVPLTMYTTQWCGFCKRLKAQLGRVGVEMNEVDIERDAEAAEFVMSVNGGNQTVPTLLFPDGSTMVNPSAAQVQAKLAQLAATAS